MHANKKEEGAQREIIIRMGNEHLCRVLHQNKISYYPPMYSRRLWFKIPPPTYKDLTTILLSPQNLFLYFLGHIYDSTLNHDFISKIIK